MSKKPKVDILPFGQSYWDWLPDELQILICRFAHQEYMAFTFGLIEFPSSLLQGAPDKSAEVAEDFADKAIRTMFLRNMSVGEELHKAFENLYHRRLKSRKRRGRYFKSEEQLLNHLYYMMVIRHEDINLRKGDYFRYLYCIYLYPQPTFDWSKYSCSEGANQFYLENEADYYKLISLIRAFYYTHDSIY
jgi:hypothetical protein